MDTARTYPKGYKMAAVNVDSEELADVGPAGCAGRRARSAA